MPITDKPASRIVPPEGGTGGESFWCPACGEGMKCPRTGLAVGAMDARTLRTRLAWEIRSWRETHGTKLEVLASSVGVSVSTVSLWENGLRYPNIENLVALAATLSLPPCRLLCSLAARPAECDPR